MVQASDVTVLLIVVHGMGMCRPLRAFDLVKDRDTGNSKGYGFCVYQVRSAHEDLSAGCSLTSDFVELDALI